MAADTAEDRRKLLVRRLVESRRIGEPAVFEAGDVEIEYDDRMIRLQLIPDERERLDVLLGAYHVFKLKQPETRKADDGVVYLSAVTDAKHAADFIESLFREVYGFGEGYELRTAESV
ncbi:MAG: hypothetical protein ACQET5_10130 [Halobacteriota archaeon]|uniref:hypothetical protein n=1 Tax=Natronomonas sp. TaxID=2184060 RepID=UPI003974F62C